MVRELPRMRRGTATRLESAKPRQEGFATGVLTRNEDDRMATVLPVEAGNVLNVLNLCLVVTIACHRGHFGNAFKLRLRAFWPG